MDEFGLIERYFQGLSSGAPGTLLGIGDDCALLQPPPGEVLAVSTDSLVAGRHFPPDTSAADIGWKTLAVGLSDLAAMGATPRWFTLALTLEAVDPDWLDAFARGLGEIAQRFGIGLVGGDTTRGPLNLNATVIGSLPADAAVRRSGARVGDAICVSGTLGDAALALAQMQAGLAPLPELRRRLDRPEPRVELGLAMRSMAHAAIDLSDGLAGDLRHVLAASGVGATIEVQRLPASVALLRGATQPLQRMDYQLRGGDDYELCLCLPGDRLQALQAVCGLPLTRIGTVTAEPGLHWVDAAGATLSIPEHAYRHFE